MSMFESMSDYIEINFFTESSCPDLYTLILRFRYLVYNHTLITPFTLIINKYTINLQSPYRHWDISIHYGAIAKLTIKITPPALDGVIA